jgi:hypothetical protein
MPRQSKANRSRSWHLERAGVWHKRARRSHSHKYSGSDTSRRPKAHRRKLVWVGAYIKDSGKRIAGYFRRATKRKRR